MSVEVLKQKIICMHCYAFLSNEYLLMWLPCDIIYLVASRFAVV